MRLLLCCEYYYPSVGGVQEVMRQVAERLVLHGHEVTVATTRLANRTFKEMNGVRIEEFGVIGNAVRGMRGEIERYRNFVKNAKADAILIKAAQQWTFDALWPILPLIKTRKVFIPCGFSGFYQPAYVNYYRELPDILKLFDHLIFYATRYRDIDFVRSHSIHNYSIIPNGASEIEFSVPTDHLFRRRFDIPADSFVFLSVGSITGLKGHLEILKAFSKLDTGGRKATLILNGNIPSLPLITGVDGSTVLDSFEKISEPVTFINSRSVNLALSALAKNSKFIQKVTEAISGVRSLIEFLFRRGLRGVVEQIVNLSVKGIRLLPLHITSYIPIRFVNPLKFYIDKINREGSVKRALLTDLPRLELIQAFMNANLFVFASNVEYSPLVLFESAAAGTPFLSVPVGNAQEIAEWTGCGIICPALVSKNGLTRVDPAVLAKEMKKAMDSPDALAKLGRNGNKRWKEKFTWTQIASRYEEVLCRPPS